MLQRTFSKGDRVVHLDKPEWGGGLVTKTQMMSRDGAQVQVVTVRFDHAGLKSLSTAHARLGLEGEYLRDNEPLAQRSGTLGETKPDAFAAPRADDSAQRLLRLPEETSDPFLPLEQRIAATLKLYRFDDSPRALIDWGIVQSGFQDPLGHFSRHDLELLYEKWQRERDRRLAELLEKLRRDDPHEFERVRGRLPAAAQQALRRRHTRR
jgi:hypothetical protein